MVIRENIIKLPYFTAQGYALGTAWVSEMSGDTVGTVLVGGMVTVRNGAFAMRAGQTVHWYWDEEERFFNKTMMMADGHQVLCGERHILNEDGVSGGTEDQQAQALKDKYSRDYDTSGPSLSDRKTGIALPKPYVLYRGHDHYGDKIRIFAKCINSGRVFDHVDLMLMTQSL